MNPTINQRVVLLRIATKIHKAAERIGHMWSPGTYEALRGGRILYHVGKMAAKYAN